MDTREPPRTDHDAPGTESAPPDETEALAPPEAPPLTGHGNGVEAGPTESPAATRADGGSRKGPRKPKRRRIAGMTVRRFLANVVLPIIGIVVIVGTLVAAPADDRLLIFLASLVAMGAGLAATSIGVYGGVLVPGLLLLGVDARFAAAASLFLQLLVIPLGRERICDWATSIGTSPCRSSWAA